MTIHTINSFDLGQQQPKTQHRPNRRANLVTLSDLTLTGTKPFQDVRKESPVPGHYQYDIRTLCRFAAGHDQVWLEQDKEPDALKILNHLQQAGVPDVVTPQDLLFLDIAGKNNIFEAIEERVGAIRSQLNGITQLHYYLYSHRIQQIAKSLGVQTERSSCVATYLADNNAIAHEYLQKRFAQIPGSIYSVPEGETIYEKDDAIALFEKLREKYPAVMVRLPYGSTGQGIRKCHTKEDLLRALAEKEIAAYLRDANPDGIEVGKLTHLIESGEKVPEKFLENYLNKALGLKIEGFESPPEGGRVVSLGVTLWIAPDPKKQKHRITGFGEQFIANDVEHDGNFYQSQLWRPELEDFLQTCSDFLHSLQAFGPNGVDLLMIFDAQDKLIKVVFMEYNPRDTGQLHLNDLTAKLTGTAFPLDKQYAGFNLKTGETFEELVDRLEREKLIYNAQKGEGALVLNLIEQAHKGMIYVLAGNDQNIAETLRRIRLY